LRPGCAVVTFGDLLRVPGSTSSLNEAKGAGADVRMVYSPFDTLKMALNEPQQQFVFAAIGFETTMPVYALMMDRIVADNIPNIRFLTSLKAMPPAIRFLCEKSNAGEKAGLTDGSPRASIDGFLAPGHVSVVTGSRIFEPLARDFQIPFAVAGFEGEEILRALYALVLTRGMGRVMNLYPSVVTREGTTEAQEMIRRYFTSGDALWRGMGIIPASGLYLREEYARYDAGSFGLTDDSRYNRACRCGQVITGQIRPTACPLFGKSCTPLTPQVACMVSPEGSCQTWFVNHRNA